MKKIILPGVDTPVSEICLGTAFFGRLVDEETSYSLLDMYYDYGGRFLNTAIAYGFGVSEACVGKWIRERGNRDEILVTSKCGEDKNYKPALHAEQLLENIDESLMSTGLEYLDFYLLHLDDHSVPVSEIMDAMAKMQKDGKIRYYGCSNWDPFRQEAANKYADAHGLSRFVMHEMEMSVARNNIPNQGNTGKWMDKEFITYHEESKVPVGAYSATTHGIFAKYAKTGDTSEWKKWLCDYYDNEYNMEIAKRLCILSKETGYSVAQIQLAWLLAQPYDFLNFLIVGPRTLEQMKDTMGVLECTLTKEMIEYLKPKDF